MKDNIGFVLCEYIERKGDTVAAQVPVPKTGEQVRTGFPYDRIEKSEILEGQLFEWNLKTDDCGEFKPVTISARETPLIYEYDKQNGNVAVVYVQLREDAVDTRADFWYPEEAYLIRQGDALWIRSHFPYSSLNEEGINQSEQYFEWSPSNAPFQLTLCHKFMKKFLMFNK